METSNRRTFLITALGALGAAVTGALLYPLFRYLAPAGPADRKQQVTIRLAELPEGDAKYFELNGTAAVLVKLKGGSVAAFSAVCTHLGCIVQWQKVDGRFLCPCHAGLFSATGAVLGGPPPKPLEKLPFVINGDSAIVG